VTNTLVFQEDIPDIDDLPPLSEARVIGEGTIFPYKDSLVPRRYQAPRSRE